MPTRKPICPQAHLPPHPGSNDQVTTCFLLSAVYATDPKTSLIFCLRWMIVTGHFFTIFVQG